jgi:hypothetical protein
MLHEALFPRLPVGKPALYAVYALAALAFGWRFRREVVADDGLLLVLAGLGLAGSIVAMGPTPVRGRQQGDRRVPLQRLLRAGLAPPVGLCRAGYPAPRLC